MSETNVVQKILALANTHNVEYQETNLDIFARKVTELAGDEVQEDPIIDLLVELKRKEVITGTELLELTHKYLKERR